MKLYSGKHVTAEWVILDFTDTTPETMVSPKTAIVIAFFPDDSNSIRDKFVTWEVSHDDIRFGYSYGHYFDKFEDAVGDYRKRLAIHLRDRQEQRAIRERGMDDGVAAASWLVDGNTPHPEEVLDRLVDGLENGDPAIIDDLPHPRLGGEFADDPTWEDVLQAELEEYDEERVQNGEYEDLFDVYCIAFSEGVEKEIRRMMKVYA
jgi:hypothetical protein